MRVHGGHGTIPFLVLLLLCFVCTVSSANQSVVHLGIISPISPLSPSEVDLRLEALDGETDATVVGAALADSSSEVRRYAALILANKPASWARPALDQLSRALDDTDPEVRRWAATALWNLRADDAALAPSLQRMLAEDTDFGQALAFRLLCHGGRVSLQEMIDALGVHDLRYVSGGALAALGGEAAPAVPALIRLVRERPDEGLEIFDHASLQDYGPRLRTTATPVEALSAIGPEALPEILSALRENLAMGAIGQRGAYGVYTPGGLLTDAISGMGAAGAPAAPTLAEFLEQYPHESALEHAITGIGERAIPAIQHLFVHSDRELRETALRAVERMRTVSPYSLTPVISLVEHSDPSMRAGSLRAWAQFDTLAALPALMHAAREDSGVVRTFAISLLSGLHEKSDEVTPLLLALVHDPDPDVAADAVVALGAIQDHPERVVPLLSDLIEDPNPHLRSAAIKALSRIGPAAAMAVPRLSRALDDPSLGAAAATALAEIGDASALPALLAVLPTVIDRDRAGLERGAGSIGWPTPAHEFVRAIATLDSCSVVEPMLNLATSQETSMYQVAASGLRRVARSCEIPLEALEATLRYSGSHRSEYFGILSSSRNSSEAMRLAIKAIDDPDESVREAASRVLSEQCPRSPECSDLAFRLLADADPRLRACGAQLLRSVDSERFTVDDARIDAVLESALADTSSDVRKHAERTLRVRLSKQREAERHR